MIKSTQFSLASVQAVLFTPSKIPFSPTPILAHMLTRHSDLFNGEVQTVPAFDQMPPEIPRIILQSQDSSWRLHGGPSRLDVYWQRLSTDPLPPERETESEDKVVAQCVHILEGYAHARGSNLTIGRLALVLGRLALVEDPQRILVDSFANEWAIQQPFRNTRDFQIHNLKRYLLETAGTEINSWVRCKSGDVESIGERGVVFEQDINTPPETSMSTPFSIDAMVAWFHAAQAEADNILEIYFPMEGQS